jgi:hypothetical protein
LHPVSQGTPAGPFIEVLNRFPVEQLEEELRKVMAQMTQLNTTAQLLRLAISAREATNGESRVEAPAADATASHPAPSPVMVTRRPKLKTAVVNVMADGEHGRAWSPTELHRALDERGWAPQTAAARSQISNRLRELVAVGKVDKIGKGLYVLVGTDEPGGNGLFAPSGSEEG